MQEWCCLRFQWYKIGATDVIITLTAKNSRNNVFRRKQTANKLLPKIFRGLEVRRKGKFMFSTTKDSMKGKYYVFSGYKQRNKVFLVYLDCKHQQDRYGWYFFKLNRQKTAEKTYLEKSKPTTRYRWCF